MEMHAYLYDYLPTAQRIMGDMLDFAVNTCEQDIEKFYGLFLMSEVSLQFQNGNPTYIAGKTGCELAKEVIAEAGMQPLTNEDEMIFILNNQDELNKRIFKFPTSQIKLNGRKSSYFEIISSLRYKECNEALTRIFPRINMNDIFNLIDNI